MATKKATKTAEKLFVIVRAFAGVFAGVLENHIGKEVTLSDSIRIWYWAGAASISQLAIEGVKKPQECKFSIPVKRHILTDVVEILFTTTLAEEIIKGVKPWKM